MSLEDQSSILPANKKKENVDPGGWTRKVTGGGKKNRRKRQRLLEEMSPHPPSRSVGKVSVNYNQRESLSDLHSLKHMLRYWVKFGIK